MKKKDNSQEITISNEFSSKLVIDLEALRDNYRKIVEFVHPATVSVVVKANAYGLGLQKIAEELFSIGCKSFFVANLEEAIELRKILPNSETTVMNYMVYHLQCSITDHPFNNTQYPALGFGPRGILGSVEFYSRCTNKKPIIHIQTVYNDNNDKLENAIEISEFGGYC